MAIFDATHRLVELASNDRSVDSTASTATTTTVLDSYSGQELKRT